MKVLSLLAASSSAQFSDYEEDYGLAGRRFGGGKDLTQYADWTGSPRSCSPNQGQILKQFRCIFRIRGTLLENSLASFKIHLKVDVWI